MVFTGLSGSGKSSLAFDTIYAEGQRRYVESLSSYARQFLGQMEKPDVESIEGLSPAISIDQKTTSRNPRSTVGTVTEIMTIFVCCMRASDSRIALNAARLSNSKACDQMVETCLRWGKESVFCFGAGGSGEKRRTCESVLRICERAVFARARWMVRL